MPTRPGSGSSTTARWGPIRCATPGLGAGVVRVHGTGKALAFTSDVTPRYVKANPFEGGKQAVAEAYRNLIAVGATPLATTDNLNFGNPEKPEIMGQFVGAIRGHRRGRAARSTCRSCRATSSLYNETDGAGILPTPTIGGVGLIARPDDLIAGRPRDGRCRRRDRRDARASGAVGASGRGVRDRGEGDAPPVDLAAERRNGEFLLANRAHVRAATRPVGRRPCAGGLRDGGGGGHRRDARGGRHRGALRRGSGALSRGLLARSGGGADGRGRRRPACRSASWAASAAVGDASAPTAPRWPTCPRSTAPPSRRRWAEARRSPFISGQIPRGSCGRRRGRAPYPAATRADASPCAPPATRLDSGLTTRSHAPCRCRPATSKPFSARASPTRRSCVEGDDGEHMSAMVDRRKLPGPEPRAAAARRLCRAQGQDGRRERRAACARPDNPGAAERRTEGCPSHDNDRPGPDPRDRHRRTTSSCS